MEAQVIEAQGRWDDETLGQQGLLVLSITGRLAPAGDNPIEVKFEAQLQFPHPVPLADDVPIGGHGYFMYNGRRTAEGHAEIRLLKRASD